MTLMMKVFVCIIATCEHVVFLLW